MGDFDSCALTEDGEVVCFVITEDGQMEILPDAPPGKFASLGTSASPSDDHCAIRSDQTVVCWRYDPDFIIETSPATRFLAVVTGWTHCGITLDRTVECWCAGDDFMTLRVMYQLEETVIDLQYADLLNGGRNGFCALTTEGATVCLVRLVSRRLVPCPRVRRDATAPWLVV